MNHFDLKYKLKPLSKLFIYIGNMLKPNLAYTYEEPYSTHIPILLAMSTILKAKYILEIGSGTYSTPNFLNKRIFPDLIKLESYEDDLKWANLVKDKFGTDNRLQLNVVEYPMYRSIKNIDISQFEIILIDDSQNAPDRTKTIIEFSKKSLKDKVLIIHDFEIESYRKAAKSLRHYFTFYSYTPCTGVLWNNGLKYSQLKKILKLIEQNKENIATTDVEGWLKVLS
jgi:hypothetical protein